MTQKSGGPASFHIASTLPTSQAVICNKQEAIKEVKTTEYGGAIEVFRVVA